MALVAPSEAYFQLLARKASTGNQMFELLVKDLWFTTIEQCFWSIRRGGLKTYHSEPKLVGTFGRSYLSHGGLNITARGHKEAALGRKVSDSELKKFVEEVLCDELERYGIVLQWYTRNTIGHQDRVLYLYHSSENIPPPL